MGKTGGGGTQGHYLNIVYNENFFNEEGKWYDDDDEGNCEANSWDMGKTGGGGTQGHDFASDS